MPEFKSKEEYEKWKDEKKKGQQENSVDPIKEVKQSATLKNSNPIVRETSSKKKVYIFLVVGLLILIPAVIFFWYYMTHGNLSGNVYVTMKSGDVKKAAGIEVMLISVPQPEKIAKDIEQMNLDTGLAVIAEYQSTSRLREEMKFLDEMEKQYEESAKKYTFSKDQYTTWAAEYRTKWIEKSKELEPSWAKLKNIKIEHNKKVSELLFSGKNNKVQTDVNGVYDFQGLSRGKYLLIARYQVFDNKVTWLTVVEIKDRGNKLDLTTNNSTSEFIYDMSKEEE